MTEKPRLIIWDLDETFWRGTLTEGGIALIPEHLELVKHLASRGIVSSICSKNDEAPVRDVLQSAGLWDYFVFPSINWDSKGPRIAALIEAMGLRPPTVLFIDDNPQNLKEAEHFAPGLQTAGPEFIATIRDNPAFSGKDDSNLTRLKQYQLLQTRHADAQQAGGDNSAFLRASGIRVHIEYDIAPHIDRAIELINRTNQLNYTKRRLPEDQEEARRILSGLLAQHGSQAGLVRVTDKYGDYGFVGFYLMHHAGRARATGVARQTLIHYCFSCRTLGMLVEQWLYEHLGKPELQVSGDVLTDLFVPRQIDWITLATSELGEETESQILAPEIRVYGGCAMNALAHYFTAFAERVEVEANFAAAGLFIRRNSLRLLRSGAEIDAALIEDAAAKLGLPPGVMPVKFAQPAPAGTVFVFEGGADAGGWRCYRHRTLGWDVLLHPVGKPDFNFLTDTTDQLLRPGRNAMEENGRLARQLAVTAQGLQADYDYVGKLPRDYLLDDLEWLCTTIPSDCLLLIVLNADTQPGPDGSVVVVNRIRRFNEMLERLVARHRHVAIVKYDDVIQDDGERLGNNHYGRMAHFRLAQKVRELVAARRGSNPIEGARPRARPTRPAPIQAPRRAPATGAASMRPAPKRRPTNPPGGRPCALCERPIAWTRPIRWSGNCGQAGQATPTCCWNTPRSPGRAATSPRPPSSPRPRRPHRQRPSALPNGPCACASPPATRWTKPKPPAWRPSPGSPTALSSNASTPGTPTSRVTRSSRCSA